MDINKKTPVTTDKTKLSTEKKRKDKQKNNEKKKNDNNSNKDEDNDKEEEESGPPPTRNKATVPSCYVWTQTLSEINTTTVLPPNTCAKHLKVDISKTKPSIKIATRRAMPHQSLKRASSPVSRHGSWTANFVELV